MKKTDLAGMTIADLKAIAKDKKIKLPAGATKAQIVKALEQAAAPAKKTASAEAAKKKPEAGNASSAAPRKDAGKAAPKKAVAVKKEKEQAPPRAGIAKPLSQPPASAAEPALPKTAVREWKMPAGIEEPMMAESRVTESKYYTGPEKHRAPARYDELPRGYDEERIVLMARDPYWAYVYWEATPVRIEREKAWFGWDSKLVVRLYDITGVQFDGMNAHGYYDQEVFDRVGSWYFDLGRPSHTFCADIGLLSPDGRFVTLARSNTATLPREGVSDVLDEEWMLLDEEFWKLYGAPGGLSSPEVQEMWRRRFMREVTSPGIFSREKAKRK